jgi:membrane-associated phospholipid phosphatase
MHWLSDVIGGLALGTAYLLVAIRAAQARLGRLAPGPAAAAAEPLEALPSA